MEVRLLVFHQVHRVGIRLGRFGRLGRIRKSTCVGEFRDWTECCCGVCCFLAAAGKVSVMSCRSRCGL
jgi:hypothetical protein